MFSVENVFIVHLRIINTQEYFNIVYEYIKRKTNLDMNLLKCNLACLNLNSLINHN